MRVIMIGDILVRLLKRSQCRGLGQGGWNELFPGDVLLLAFKWRVSDAWTWRLQVGQPPAVAGHMERTVFPTKLLLLMRELAECR